MRVHPSEVQRILTGGPQRAGRKWWPPRLHLEPVRYDTSDDLSNALHLHAVACCVVRARCTCALSPEPALSLINAPPSRLSLASHADVYLKFIILIDATWYRIHSQNCLFAAATNCLLLSLP